MQSLPGGVGRGGWVKICGITTARDIDLCAAAGADAVGLNLWSRSPRAVSLELAAQLAERARGLLEVVVVLVNPGAEWLQAVVERVQPTRLQFHGDEPPHTVAAWQPRAYKAVGLAGSCDVDSALAQPGHWVLVDARDITRRGGTGRQPPLRLAKAVAAQRPVVLAGGLTPDNVVDRIEQVGPVGVDSASGVEAAPGRKDAHAVREFVARARSAWRGSTIGEARGGGTEAARDV